MLGAPGYQKPTLQFPPRCKSPIWQFGNQMSWIHQRVDMTLALIGQVVRELVSSWWIAKGTMYDMWKEVACKLCTEESVDGKLGGATRRRFYSFNGEGIVESTGSSSDSEKVFGSRPGCWVKIGQLVLVARAPLRALLTIGTITFSWLMATCGSVQYAVNLLPLWY